jgi:hypothetical protein
VADLDVDDRLRLAALVRELQQASALPLTLPAAVAFQLAALVQLALRHAHVPPHVRDTGEQLIAVVRGHFADCPTVLDTLRTDFPAARRSPFDVH